jgi:hypothetical protein
LCWIGAASGRRKSEEPPLFLPIVRQSPGEHDEPGGRQLDGLVADQDRANDFRREIRETHEPRHIIAPHAKPRRHGVDAVITARKEHAAKDKRRLSIYRLRKFAQSNLDQMYRQQLDEPIPILGNVSLRKAV